MIVLAWLDLCVEVRDQSEILTRDAYEQFRAWAVSEGFKTDKLPAINGFTQRVVANVNRIEYRRTANQRLFLGLAIKSSTTQVGHADKFDQAKSRYIDLFSRKNHT